MKIQTPATRTCPECDQFGLEVTDDPNTYECQVCGSIWARLRPLNDGTGRMILMPPKLKKLLEGLEKTPGKKTKPPRSRKT